jgi:predicted enzyme related to lactoylglutathione lyase
MTLESAAAITFFYYNALGPAIEFYENALGLELIADQSWARIYRIQGTAYLGIVEGERGFCRTQEKNAVLLTLVVRDVDAWYAKLVDRGVPVLREIETHEDIQVRCFFVQDPGGYAVEIQTFLEPSVAEVFGL